MRIVTRSTFTNLLEHGILTGQGSNPLVTVKQSPSHSSFSAPSLSNTTDWNMSVVVGWQLSWEQQSVMIREEDWEKEVVFSQHCVSCMQFECSKKNQSFFLRSYLYPYPCPSTLQSSFGRNMASCWCLDYWCNGTLLLACPVRYHCRNIPICHCHGQTVLAVTSQHFRNHPS